MFLPLHLAHLRLVTHVPGLDIWRWRLCRKQSGRGVWWFWGALKGENVFSSLIAAGDWVKKGSHHTAWSVPLLSSCSCSYLFGQGTAIGPRTGERCWPLLSGIWSAIAPLVKPRCAEDAPIAVLAMVTFLSWMVRTDTE